LAEAARFVLDLPKGATVVVAGIDAAGLRDAIDQAEDAPTDRRALFMRLRPAPTVASYVEQATVQLAETARRLWPDWFATVSFAACGPGTLGKLAAGAIAHEAASTIPGVSAAWTEAAARLALDGRPPRVAGALPAVELSQLALAISPGALALVIEFRATAETGANSAALVHALEWIAQHGRAAVVALLPELPAFEQPFDRLLYGARRVVVPLTGPDAPPLAMGDGDDDTWLTPWRGRPHPMSEIEQRLKAMLDADAELASLFCFNWAVETVRGSKPKIDLVWLDGRLAVELDGYSDHGPLPAFIRDRHRDYELALSGYTVLRLANDEIKQDFGKAIEKIRDLVRLRRSLME
jgi:very-short-patch-repair endonuclease